MDSWTDGHARLVAATAPHVDDLDLDRVWARVEAEVDDRTPMRRRRPIRVVVGAGIAALVLSISGVAAADLISARTSTGPESAEDERLGGPGERLDLAGTDMAEVIDEETTDIPFPSAAARRVSIDEHVRDFRSGASRPGAEFVSTGALRAWTAVHAVCSWSNAWVVSRRDGDEVAEAEAARMLVEARAWPAITDIDPRQTTRMVERETMQRDGTLTSEILPDPTQFYYLRQVAAAVESGDVAALGSTLADNAYCRWLGLQSNT